MHRMCLRFNSLLVILAVSLGAMVKAEAAEQTPGDRKVQIVAKGMQSEGCAQSISGQLYAARGVKTVEVDLDTQIVSVSLAPKKSATLGQLWKAVEQNEGGPTKLVTTEATYTLTPIEVQSRPGQPPQKLSSALYIVVDNLHCMGCAKKISAQLYTLKGVTNVRADLKKDTITVEARPGTLVSPWQAIAAVAKAKERPLAVTGAHGTVSIEWSTKRAPKVHKKT